MADLPIFTTMQRDSIHAFFESSPAVRLLRSDYAPLLIEFLVRTFKVSDLISIGQSDLQCQLRLFQSELRSLQSSLLNGPAERYLTQWVEAGWLHRFIEATSCEPQYQLTKYAEIAIRFVDSTISQDTNMVGTESRLRLIMETLEDIVRGSSDDPGRRIEFLKSQRDQLEAEIAALESGQTVQTYRPAQIRERFQTAVELLKALQSDFRAVEERFQQIAADVQQLQSSGMESRGQILGYAMDAEDMLKNRDEGISFHAFVAFLFSPVQQAALLKNISELQKLEALGDENEAMLRVRRMVPSLLAEADKVMRTTARLSSTLRRLLDARSATHRVRLAEVLRTIRSTALSLNGQPDEAIELEIESELDLVSPLSRSLWSPPTEFEPQTLVQHVSNVDDAKQITAAFAKLQRLDLRALRRSIRDLVHDGRSRSIGEMTVHRKVQSVVELLALIQIAHDDGHTIDPSTTETIDLDPGPAELSPLRVTIPRVLFHPKASLHDVNRRPK